MSLSIIVETYLLQLSEMNSLSDTFSDLIFSNLYANLGVDSVLRCKNNTFEICDVPDNRVSELLLKRMLLCEVLDVIIHFQVK